MKKRRLTLFLTMAIISCSLCLFTSCMQSGTSSKTSMESSSENSSYTSESSELDSSDSTDLSGQNITHRAMPFEGDETFRKPIHPRRAPHFYPDEGTGEIPAPMPENKQSENEISDEEQTKDGELNQSNVDQSGSNSHKHPRRHRGKKRR